MLFFEACTHKVFFPFLEQNFPHLLKKYQDHFLRNPFLYGPYPARIAEMIETLRSRYGLGERFPEYKPADWEEEPQLELQFSVPASITL